MIMKEYKVETFAGIRFAERATEAMNNYAAQGWEVLRVEGINGGIVVVFVREKQ